MLVILMGKSASGKDSVLNKMVCYKEYNPIIPITSRPIRNGEINGRDYYFVTKDEFLDKIKNNELLEYRDYQTLVNGIPDTWYYGSSKMELDADQNYVVILDVDGAKSFIDYYGKENILCIYLDTNDQIRENRAKQRGSFDKTEWDRRLKDDYWKFSSERLAGIADLLIENNSNTINNIVNIISLAVTHKKNQYENIKQSLYSDSDILDSQVGDGIFHHGNHLANNRYDFFQKYQLEDNFTLFSYYPKHDTIMITDQFGSPIFFCKSKEHLQNIINKFTYDDFLYQFLDAYPNYNLNDADYVLKQITNQLQEKEIELPNISHEYLQE